MLQSVNIEVLGKDYIFSVGFTWFFLIVTVKIMAAEVPAKKLRVSEEESEPWTNQEPGFINLRVDVSKYSHCSLNIETMSHEELLQIFWSCSKGILYFGYFRK